MSDININGIGMDINTYKLIKSTIQEKDINNFVSLADSNPFTSDNKKGFLNYSEAGLYIQHIVKVQQEELQKQRQASTPEGWLLLALSGLSCAPYNDPAKNISLTTTSLISKTTTIQEQTSTSTSTTMPVTTTTINPQAKETPEGVKVLVSELDALLDTSDGGINSVCYSIKEEIGYFKSLLMNTTNENPIISTSKYFNKLNKTDVSTTLGIYFIDSYIEKFELLLDLGKVCDARNSNFYSKEYLFNKITNFNTASDINIVLDSLTVNQYAFVRHWIAETISTEPLRNGSEIANYADNIWNSLINTLKINYDKGVLFFDKNKLPADILIAFPELTNGIDISTGAAKLIVDSIKERLDRIKNLGLDIAKQDHDFFDANWSQVISTLKNNVLSGNFTVPIYPSGVSVDISTRIGDFSFRYASDILFLINNSKSSYTNKKDITLNFNMPEAVKMKIRSYWEPGIGFLDENDVKYDTSTEWIPYSPSYSMTIPGNSDFEVQFEYADGTKLDHLVYGSIYIDTTSPVKPYIQIEEVHTNSASINVTFGAEGASKVRFRYTNCDDTKFNTEWSEWHPYPPPVFRPDLWCLATGVPQNGVPVGQGWRTLQAQFSDDAGNLSEIASDQVCYDTIHPYGSININQGATSVNNKNVTLYLAAKDDSVVNGLHFLMHLRNDDQSWTSWMSFEETKSWILQDIDGMRSVSVQYKDDAGNESEIYAATIELKK